MINIKEIKYGEGSITIAENRLAYLALAAFGLLTTATGVWMGMTAENAEVYTGYLSALFFGACTIFMAYKSMSACAKAVFRRDGATIMLSNGSETTIGAEKIRITAMYGKSAKENSFLIIEFKELQNLQVPRSDFNLITPCNAYIGCKDMKNAHMSFHNKNAEAIKKLVEEFEKIGLKPTTRKDEILPAR